MNIGGPTVTNPSNTPSSQSISNPQKERDTQSITLRVMRLSKPSFQINFPILTEMEDIAGCINPPDSKGIEALGFSEMLTLPNSFGTIYVGETFSTYITIHNHSPFDVKNFSLKAELQTSNQRFGLLDNTANPSANFHSGDCHDCILHHPVKESGIHILVCTVNYALHTGEKKMFRKYFKFLVSIPISVKTFTHLSQDTVFVTAQVKNATQSSYLFLESVKLEPSPLYNVSDLSSVDDPKLSNGMGDLVYLKSGDVRQYLFRLDPKNPQDGKAKTSPALGRLDIVWRSNLGEMGRLQTGTLERKLPPSLDVELSLKDIPPHVQLEKPFVVRCDLVNRSKKTIVGRILLLKNKMDGILITGLSGQYINLPVNQTVNVQLTLFPIKPGVQKISGIRIEDEHEHKTFDFIDVADVFCV